MAILFDRQRPHLLSHAHPRPDRRAHRRLRGRRQVIRTRPRPHKAFAPTKRIRTGPTSLRRVHSCVALAVVRHAGIGLADPPGGSRPRAASSPEPGAGARGTCRGGQCPHVVQVRRSARSRPCARRAPEPSPRRRQPGSADGQAATCLASAGQWRRASAARTGGAHGQRAWILLGIGPAAHGSRMDAAFRLFSAIH